MSAPVPLTRLLLGEEAVVAEVLGGYGCVRRLEALGIRPGVRIRVVNRFSFGGPVTVCVGRTEIALGRGMAKRVLVQREP